MKNKRKTSIGRRALAVLLGLIMVLTLVPVSAFADGNGGSGTGTGSGGGTDEEYVQEGVFDWPYDDDETEHTVYYKPGQYPGGLTCDESELATCKVAQTYYNDPDHLWEGTWTKPTCTDMGIYNEECLFCHAHRVTYQKPTGHRRYKMLSSTEPGCTTEGVDIYKCQWCDAKIRYTTPAIGHYWVLDEYTTKEPTVWEDGHYDYKCAREGCSETKSEPVPALGGYKLPKIRELEVFGEATYGQYFRTWQGIKYSDIWGINLYDTYSAGSNGNTYLEDNRYVTCTVGTNDLITIKGGQISNYDNHRSVAIVYAQDLYQTNNRAWCDVIVDVSAKLSGGSLVWSAPLDVYLVDFGITNEAGHRTKGLASVTVKGDSVNVYLVNSNIGFIDYKASGTSDYYDLMDGTTLNESTGQVKVSEFAYIAVDGYNSHVFMGPDVNAANPKAAHVKVSVNGKMPYKGRGDRTTLWYNAINPYEKFWWMMESIYGTSFATSFDYIPTVELCNLTVDLLGSPVNESACNSVWYGMSTHSDYRYIKNVNVSNGVFKELGGASLYNCDWHVGTVEANDFSWMSLSNTDLSDSNGVSQVNLHNRARLTVGGEQTCNITSYGTNRLYLDSATLKGNITAEGVTDDIYNAYQDGDRVEDNSTEDPESPFYKEHKDYVPDPDPDKVLTHAIKLGKNGYSYFKGADLTLFLTGESNVYTENTTDNYSPDIMVDNEAYLYIKDDTNTDGVGKLSVGKITYNPQMINPWGRDDGGHYYCAAIGGTKNGLVHGHITIESGIVDAWSFNGGAAIGGSNQTGFSKDGGWVTITGGVVNVEAHSGAAGIGGAAGGNAASIGIGGGTVNAKVDGGGAALGGGEAVYDTEYKVVGYQMLNLRVGNSITPIYVYVDENGTKRYHYTTSDANAWYTDSNGTRHDITEGAEYVEYPGDTLVPDITYAIYAKTLVYVTGGAIGSLGISAGSVVTAWADNPAYDDFGDPIGLEKYYYRSEDGGVNCSTFDPGATGKGGTVGKYFYRDADHGNEVTAAAIDLLYPVSSGGYNYYSNGRTAGYVIGGSSGEAAILPGKRVSSGIGRGMNPLIILGQNRSRLYSGDLNASADHYYLPDGTSTQIVNGEYLDTDYHSQISHLTGIMLAGFDTGSNNYVFTSKLGKYAYKFHGQIDLPDLGTPTTLTLKAGTTLTLVDGSVMNVPGNFEIVQEAGDQLIVEEGCVIQGKGLWPGKPTDPANPPTTEQVRSILERLKTENSEEQVATHLAIVQTADGESTVIDGTSADDVRRKMAAALLTEDSLLTMLNAGSYGFTKEGSVWKLKSYDPKMVVSLTENGALAASPGKYSDNTKRFDVLVSEAASQVVVKLQSARLSTPEYKIYDGQADDEIILDLGSAGSEFSITVDLSKEQVRNNSCVFNVPKFGGSEFSLSTIKVLRRKCALRYSGTMKFTTPVMDIAGIDITELQINYANGSKLGGINGSGFVGIPSIAGFPVSGNAEMTLNTFAPNRELSLSVELETPIFEGAFEASFKETRGIIMIDTLYAEIAAGEGGIPLVPPTVIGYLQGGGLGFTGLADTISMDSFGAPPIRLKMAAKGSIMDVIEGWARLSLGPSGFDLELSDITIADASFIKEYGISASWDAQEKEIDGYTYWGLGADMSQYIVIAIPLKSYGGYDNSENGVIGGISATGSVGIGGFAGYRTDGNYLCFVYQLHASGSINGSVSIPKNLIAGIPFKRIELASVDMGFYAEANATTRVDKSTVNGSATSVLRQLASSADLNFNAVIGAKATAGVGDAKCFVRLIYVLGETGLDFDAGLGSGKSLDLSSYVSNKSKNYSVLGTSQIKGSDEPVPTIYQAGATTAAKLKKGLVQGRVRGASDTVELKLLNEKTVSATVNDALANSSIIMLTLADGSTLATSQISVTDADGDPVALVPEVYDAEGTPTVNGANFYADEGMICFVPSAAGKYTITINDGVNAEFADGEVIVTKAFATLDQADTAFNNNISKLSYKVNDAAENTRYKVQVFLGTEQGNGDYLLAETGELSAADLANVNELAYSLTGSAAPSGSYYPGVLLLEYVEAEDAAGQVLGTWAAVDQIYGDSATLPYTNTEEIAAPSNVVLKYSGNGSMTANWTTVSGADVYQLAVYEEVSDAGAAASTHLEDTGLRFVTDDASTSYIMDLSSLAAGERYCVGVSAVRYNREEAGEGNFVISPDGKYQNGREYVSQPELMPQAEKPSVTYSDNVIQGEGNSHTMAVPAAGASFVIRSSRMLDVSVKEKESGKALTVTYDDLAWTVEVPAVPSGSAVDAPYELEVVAKNPTEDGSGDYVLDYITVTADSIAPPLVVDNMGNFPRWQIESGFYASITGHSEAGARVYLYEYNKDRSEFEQLTAVYASEDGSFSLPVQFNGKPLFCVQAEDAAGNKTEPVSIGFPNPDINLKLNLGAGTSGIAGIGLVSGSQIGTMPTPTPCTEDGVIRSFTGWYLHVDTIIGVTTAETYVKDADGNYVTDGSGNRVTTLVTTGTPQLTMSAVLVDPGMVFTKTEDGKVTAARLVQGTGANAGKLVEEVFATFDSDPVLYAGWDASVNITFVQGEGASCPEDTRVIAQNTAIGKLPTPVRTDGASRVFDGWYTEGGARVTEDYIVRASESSTARWKDVVNVSFDAGIGGIDLSGLNLSEEEAEHFAETSALIVESGSAITTYPAASATGYAFLGWFTDPDAENAQPVGSGTVFSQDTTLTAKWTRNIETFTVTQADGIEGQELADPVYTTPASPAALGLTPTITYARTVSYTDDDGVSRTKTYTTTSKPTEPGDCTVTVQFDTAEKVYQGVANFTIAAAPHSINIDNTALVNGVLSADMNSAAVGDIVTITASPESGYALESLTVTDSIGKTIKVTYDVGDHTNVCTFTMPGREVNVSATFCDSVDLNVTATLVGAGVDVSPAGPLRAGREVKLTAPYTAGYNFDGWFSGEQLISANLEYSFTITEDTDLMAKYSARGNATISISSVRGEFTVSGSNTPQTNFVHDYPLGTQLTLTAVDPDNVLQWESGSNKVLGRGASITITVTGSMTIKLVYQGSESAESAYVQFLSDYGQVLSAQTYGLTDPIDFPVSPSKLGYDFQKWVFDSTDDEATVESIRARIGSESSIIIKPKYVKNNTTYTVSVVFEGAEKPDGWNDVYSGIHEGNSLTLTAPEIEGKTFAGWKDSAGTILSYISEYHFKVSSDITLKACYAESAPQPVPVVVIGDLYTTVSGETHKVSGQATRSVPNGYTLVEQGMLYARDVAGLNEDNFKEGTAGVSIYRSPDLAPNDVLTVNAKVANDDVVVSLRAYLLVRNNATGNEQTIYSNIASGSYNSLNP